MEAFEITLNMEKKLKEFLGSSMPAPIDGKSIKLHDLLSKPFCEAMANKKVRIEIYANASREIGALEVYAIISRAYFNSGLPAVEKALMDMMGEK